MTPELIEEEAELQAEPVEDIQEDVENTGAVGTVFTQTIDDIPELGNKQVNDTITFKVSDISGDGIYQLEFMADAPGTGIEGVAVAGPEGAEADILAQLGGAVQ